MNPFSISVFFPTYNEEGNIEKTIIQAEKVLKEICDESQQPYEIIVINDGSSDATRSIVDSIALVNPHVRVVHHEKNKGYGAALSSGFQAARYDLVFFSDADLQFDMGEIRKLLKYIPEYKVVIGYRSPRRDHWGRLFNAKGWNLLARLLFGLKVKDIDCAFKLCDRKLMAELPLVTCGQAVSVEMLVRLQKKGIVWKEVPVTHFPRYSGSPTGARPLVIWKAFKELFGLYWKGI